MKQLVRFFVFLVAIFLVVDPASAQSTGKKNTDPRVGFSLATGIDIVLPPELGLGQKKEKTTPNFEMVRTQKTFSYIFGGSSRKELELLDLNGMVKGNKLTIPKKVGDVSVPFIGGKTLHLDAVRAEAENEEKFSVASCWTATFFSLVQVGYEKSEGAFSPQMPDEHPLVATRIWSKEELFFLSVDGVLTAPRKVTAYEISAVIRPLDIFTKKADHAKFIFFYSPYFGYAMVWDPSVLRFEDLVGEEGLKSAIQDKTNEIPGASHAVGQIYDLAFPNFPVIDPLYRGWDVGCDFGMNLSVKNFKFGLALSPEVKFFRHWRNHGIKYSTWSIPLELRVGVGFNWPSKKKKKADPNRP